MSKYILLSIKPHIIKEIISGEKKFEFRKKFPNLNKEESCIEKTILIYSSTPQMKIVGSFIVKKYYSDSFDKLMKIVNASEVYKLRISKYFIEKDECHALEISNFKIYEVPLTLNYLRDNHNNFYPGQSYRYLEKNHNIVKDIIKKNGCL